MDSFSKTLDKIYNLRGGIIDLRLDRMERALALFNHPENNFASIHIAGTNGKGSTAAMLHSILSGAGYRTALYTSPHLVSFTERIRIDGDEIAQDEVITIAEEVWRHTTAADVPLTFFEFVTIMAFIYFSRRQSEIAVIEVGLGGRLDATNVITPLVCAITTISKDHEAYLGADEISIAREKAGIIKAQVPVVLGKVSEAVADVLRKIAGELQAPAYLVGSDFSFSLKDDGLFDYTGIKQRLFNLELGLIGRHQRANASVALAALELIREYFPVDENAVRAGLRQVRWPGRLEVMFEQPTVILDGAHNPEGVKSLVDELSTMRRGGRIKLLFATMADKEWKLMLRALAGAADEITFTQVAMERSAEPHVLAENFSQSIPQRVISNSRAALRTLLSEAERQDVIVVAGSLYLLGEVRPLLEEIAKEKAAQTCATDSHH